VTTVYDALDLVRGIDVFLYWVPGASLVALRRGFRSIGITSSQVIGYSDPRANSMGLALTPNTETTHGTTMLDLNAWASPGPTRARAAATCTCHPATTARSRTAPSPTAARPIHANDLSFYQELGELVQEEPIEALDAERAGQLAASGS
jgi:hypothetical protein